MSRDEETVFVDPEREGRLRSQRIKKPFGGEQVRGLNVEEAGDAASGWVTLSSECILRSTLTHPCRRALGDLWHMH